MEVKTDGASFAKRSDSPNPYEFQAGYFKSELTLAGKYNWEEGDPIVIWKREAQDGLCFEGGKNLFLRNIKVESSLHFAIKLRGVSNAAILECLVVPVAKGMISSGAYGIDVQAV